MIVVKSNDVEEETARRWKSNGEKRNEKDVDETKEEEKKGSEEDH